MKIWENVSLEALPKIAQEIWEMLPPEGVVCFKGEMGAGKTTLINAITKVAGVIDETSSPTYSMVNEYHTKLGKKIYHFDCYRINTVAEALDIGIEDYWYDKTISLVEWPEQVAEILPEKYTLITIKSQPDKLRNIELK